MKYDEKAIADLVEKVIRGLNEAKQPGRAEAPAGAPEKEDTGETIPVGVSNRHIHLSQADLDTLFGPGYQLTPLKPLSQPGQYACKEQLTLIGPSLKALEGVRILGPLRGQSQVEISRTDSYFLKLRPPVRESGALKGSSPITVVGPRGVLQLKEGCILANRHIHMSPEDGKSFGVKDGDYVPIESVTDEKHTVLYDVQIRVSEKYRLEMHLDTDDANACGIANGTRVRIRKDLK